VFTAHIGSFEPTVMFFGMTNSPATFQAMMNEILRDLINKRKVAAFVDDVLVGTETKEGHNEIVEEILRRLEENDLYIKPEKCVWKARKIGFLGVIIGPDGIEMEAEKVDGVLSWPQPKNVKDIERGKRDVYYDKQVGKAVTVLNCMLKGSWGEEGSGGIRKKLKNK